MIFLNTKLKTHKEGLSLQKIIQLFLEHSSRTNYTSFFKILIKTNERVHLFQIIIQN